MKPYYLKKPLFNYVQFVILSRQTQQGIRFQRITSQFMALSSTCMSKTLCDVWEMDKISRFSHYFFTRDAENKKRYNPKLSLIDGEKPYTSKKADLS